MCHIGSGFFVIAGVVVWRIPEVCDRYRENIGPSVVRDGWESRQRTTNHHQKEGEENQ